MKKISYLLIGIFVMFIGLTKTLALDYSGDFFAQPVVITFYLNDSHNALNTRPEEWEFCFEDSEDPDYYKVCLKISDDKVQSFINDMPYPDDVTQYAEFTEEKNDNSMDMYKLEFNWHRVVGTTLGTKNNYKVTIKGITDNSKYNLVSGTPTNITRDTRNYTAYFSLSGLRHIKGTIIFNDENDRDGIREGLLSDFYLGYDGLDKNDLTSEDFLRLRHDVYNSNRYTFEEYVAKYYDNGFTRPKTYTLEFFGPELTKENIIVTKNVISDDEEEWNITINYTPEKIAPVNVKVNWDDDNDKNNKRPPSLNIDFLNNDDITERSIELTNDNWETKVENLFKNYKGEEITYTLKVSNVDNYIFTVTGNQTDGFVINATYKINTSGSTSHSTGNNSNGNNNSGTTNKDIPKDDKNDNESKDNDVPKEDLKNDENINNIEIPNTSDSIIESFGAFIISLLIIILYKKYRNIIIYRKE